MIQAIGKICMFVQLSADTSNASKTSFITSSTLQKDEKH